MINTQNMADIRESLEREYSSNEVSLMLKTAKFEKGDGKLVVTYDNGRKDVFIYVNKLVHINELTYWGCKIYDNGKDARKKHG